jgi:hypothetical protein
MSEFKVTYLKVTACGGSEEVSFTVIADQMPTERWLIDNKYLDHSYGYCPNQHSCDPSCCVSIHNLQITYY